MASRRATTAIAGLGITEQGKVYGPSAVGFAVEAVRLALDDAGLAAAATSTACCVNPGLDLGTGRDDGIVRAAAGDRAARPPPLGGA